jgi:hypothetical protein
MAMAKDTTPPERDTGVPGLKIPLNPTPLSAPQEQQVREIYYKNVRAKCDEQIRGGYMSFRFLRSRIRISRYKIDHVDNLFPLCRLVEACNTQQLRFFMKIANVSAQHSQNAQTAVH